MNINNQQKIKLAIQRNGRLTEDALKLLRCAGLELESYRQKLISVCRNFPLDLLYVRDNDIGGYVESGAVDLGILGQNLLYEQRFQVKKLLNLRFGFCSLITAAPKESNIDDIRDLNNKRVATSYPNSAKIYFDKNKINVEIIKISGSVEIAPTLGIADAIVDLTSSGSTLILNDMKIINRIYVSEAVLIANNNSYIAPEKKKLFEKLMQRVKGVLSAKKYKFITMEIPQANLIRLSKLIPGIKSWQNFTKIKKGNISVSSLVDEYTFWEMLERLKKLEVSQIAILPVEKFIG